MKKIFLFTTILFSAIVLMALTLHNDDSNIPLNSYGAQPGFAGDPAGGGLFCTSCHSGPTPTFQAGWITSDIPPGGYVPGATYTITASAAGVGHSRFGFEATPQNSNGDFLGTLINTGTQTQLTSDPNYITHTSAGSSGSGSKTWTFDWVAPISNSGPVTFYAAFCISNSSNNPQGDTIVFSTLSAFETTTGLFGSSKSNNIVFYPNPFSTSASIFSGTELYNAELTIFDLRGQHIRSVENISGKSFLFHRENLSAGIYFYQLAENDKLVAVGKFAVADN